MSIGTIPEFRLHKDNWRIYVERLEQYLIVNKIPEELHVPTLITVMGVETYELLVTLCKPSKPKAKTFKELTLILENHLQPSVLAERYKFRQRQQRAGETLAEYIAALKKMSDKCEFGRWWNESLCDQFIFGIRNETIRQKLFSEDNVDFVKACQVAESIETVGKEATASADTSKVDTGAEGRQTSSYSWRNPRPYRPPQQHWSSRESNSRQQSQICSVCSGRHETSVCRLAEFACSVCHSQGHMARNCPSK
ncbi:uncharacterized protein LOC128202328 [Galleria mellonella]|uniref:Uncharacterized protein LOC128202328 n=1 Tax=Galleria mellonella TaxID=7137 RepID=A0ABM3N3S9_GALME|nr:uncharacterized protein LOC128202328 [Galleria mellonella]